MSSFRLAAAAPGSRRGASGESVDDYLTGPPTIILEGFLKKVGRLLNGTTLRWIQIRSDFTLLSCTDRGAVPTKSYNLLDCIVQWGQLASKESAIRIECRRRSGQRRKLTFIVENVLAMQRWVGALRCLFAGTDSLLCDAKGVGGSTCTICIRDYEDGDTLSVLPCDHTFCPDCIERWFQLSQYCPNCKRDATIHGIPLVRRGNWSSKAKNRNSGSAVAGGGGAGESKTM